MPSQSLHMAFDGINSLLIAIITSQSAQRKALDILNTVGLSNSVLKLIERRHRLDKWIAYAGMIITIVVMIVFWRLTH